MTTFEAVNSITLDVADPGDGNSLAQYVFVTVNSSGEIVAAAADADAVGVTLESVTKAEFDEGKRVVSVAQIEAGGKCPVRVAASAAVAIGATVASGANGEAVTSNAGAAGLGVALSAATADADQEVIQMLFSKAARQA